MSVRERIQAKWREYSVGVLAVVAAALLVGLLLSRGSSTGEGIAPAVDPHDAGQIDSVIDATLARFGIDAASGHVVHLRRADIPPPRKEIRFEVPPSFVPVLFNHELALRLEPFGAKIIGTEDPPSRRVVVHVRLDGYVIRSLVFQEKE